MVCGEACTSINHATINGLVSLLSLYARPSLHLPRRTMNFLSSTKEVKVDGNSCTGSQKLDPQADGLMTETLYLG